ncbi:MAG: hydrogenase formation protein HypD [Gemmatimonadota bacterium]|nr:MAG: hydrogenase formation protein HypD [Gemmatimonadota bacterium]
MRHVSEYRDREIARKLLDAVRISVTRRWVLMEVCGGQTHTILRHGLDELLADCVELIHGPGCPVCVTPVEDIDTALELAKRQDLILASFGDMLRVPGSHSDLLRARAGGADVRTVYSPLDALDIARQRPDKEVVFFAVGFETTAPTTAMAVRHAREVGLSNFTLLVSHVTVLPAVTAILASPGNRVQALLAAGHVCTVMGWREYEPIAAQYRVPIVVTGFEPVDILEGVLMAVHQLEGGRHQVENQYSRSVRREGNRRARDAMTEVFERVDRTWRGLGKLPGGGLALRQEFADFDARRRFGRDGDYSEETTECRAGEVLRGLLNPVQCPAFGSDCTPDRPLGAPMVSSEGACAAYYRHRRPVATGAHDIHE